MKKYSAIFFIMVLPVLFCFFGCADKFELYKCVTETRENIYFGKSENYEIKAYYGFKKNEKNEKVYSFTFFLLNAETDNSDYSVLFTINGKKYEETFSFSPIDCAVSAKAETQNINLNTINITINKGSSNENITLSSIKPKSTVSLSEAINSLYEKQKTFIDGFLSNGQFNGKLAVRLVVKDEKSYYYIGFTDKDNNTTAMLIDGKTKELLALRQIF